MIVTHSVQPPGVNELCVRVQGTSFTNYTAMYITVQKEASKGMFSCGVIVKMGIVIKES